MAAGKPQWYRVNPATGHYLDPQAFQKRRPISQGDVFLDIPFPVPKHPAEDANARRQTGFAKLPLREPLPGQTDINRIRASMRLKVKMGMILPHTCEYYEMQAGPSNPTRVLALVRELSQEKIPDDWDGQFHLFPLPNLLGDGKYYLAQLDTLVTVEEAFLAKENRRVCLSFDGWLALQQRVAHFFARFYAPWEDLEAIQAPYWSEIANHELQLASEEEG